VVSFTLRPLHSQGNSPWYPLDRRLGGPQSRSGRGGEEKDSQPPPGIKPYNPGRPARSPALKYIYLFIYLLLLSCVCHVANLIIFITCILISRRFKHIKIRHGSGAHPASYPMGTRGCFPGVKRVRREADHSLQSSAEVKNAWSYASTPPIRLHGVVLS
jgi:hypothetical protein